jgi:tetratricopeptide (TPR) repeat protein
MSLSAALCIGKICVGIASIVTAVRTEQPLDHLKEIFEAVSSGSEAAAKLRGPEVPTLGKALETSRATLEEAYAESLKNSHSTDFAETVDLAFANLAEVFDTCMPHGQELAKLKHDPDAIGNFVADAAVAQQIEAFRDGEGRKILVALVTLAYASLDRKPEFMASLQRVNWKQAFEQLANIESDTTALRAQQVADSAKLDELLALARTGGAFQRARKEGIPEAAVRAIVERLGGQGIEREDLLPWLDNWIESARQELGRYTNEDEAFEAARLEAERRFKAGRPDASAALMDEFNRDKCAEIERQKERKRRNVRLLETAIRIDGLQLNTDGVVSKLRELAAVEGLAGTDDVGAFLMGRAREFYELGDQKGENAASLMAIAIFRAALEDCTRDRVPLDWAKTQSNLGSALRTLGERESGALRLEEAVMAFRTALKEYTRDRVPLDWAATQNNLGNALQTLGERESGMAQLDRAVTAYRAALEEYTRDRVPLDWAATQNNLGSALSTLGERESGTARLEEAVTAYRAALEEYMRDRVPLDWAMTQNNLGTVLSTLGERENGTARLEQAVTAYRAALQERTRERVPLQWATTQNNLGNALRLLGQRESGTARLEQAVTAFRAGLEEWKRERVPLDWAIAQHNLGSALRVLGEREKGTARLEEAVAAYRAALEELTQERAPWHFERTQASLDRALRILEKRLGK